MNKVKWYTVVALLLAIWFAITSWFWAWALALFISFPFGILSLILYFIGRRYAPESRLNRIVLIILMLGLASSIITLVVLSLNN